ncbi:glucuronate isomerase [Sphingomonas sp. Leaf407]|uniref:glucuronate isomerase n=1 Tax=unclassified Sphingomonas TaxID=196159 RepID=UPI0006FFE721|nr:MULTISPECIES: glucuronate isomerase [unclassified Sphingomonas]KQN37404.1 glucuronate isomerase [Sphingomonas sp. Leaf42]KQT27773.1 glucuronate isomerase [Sphingomonas sp. Leaf407]
MPALLLDPDRLFPADPTTRGLARELYAEIRDLPIVSPHGHTDPSWFATDRPWRDATELLLSPDHYIFRMLYSQGVALDDVAVPRRDGSITADPRAAWRVFAAHQHLFRGTPSRLWLDHVFGEVFGFDEALTTANADTYFDRIGDLLASDAYRPRALFDRFGIELIATTEGADDPLLHHRAIRESGWGGRVVTAYRPDAVIDCEHEAFRPALLKFADLTGEDVHDWQGYLAAHRKRRQDFIAAGATSTDHGHPTARTANLSTTQAEALFAKVIGGTANAADAELFRAQMLTEMARMSIDDGLVMQIHPGSFRNHNRGLFDAYGRDKGADIPTRTDYVAALKPMLDVVGTSTELTIILFTLDETTYARELAPLAGHYPCLRLGPAWWFHDSPEGMRRFREMTTETAGFYNTVGFNDDTRAFLSIPARHDVARRVDCAFLARLVAEHRLALDEAHAVAHDLTYALVKQAYKL